MGYYVIIEGMGASWFEERKKAVTHQKELNEKGYGAKLYNDKNVPQKYMYERVTKGG